MLTSSNNKRFTYLRRVAVLPVVIFTCLLFAFNFKHQEIFSTEDIAKGSFSPVTTTGKKVMQLTEEMFLSKLDTTIKNNQTTNNSSIKMTAIDTFGNEDIVVIKGVNNGGKPITHLVVLDGIMMTWQEFKNLDLNSEKIKRVNVFKDESAVEKFGEKGREGVIEIVTNSGTITQQEPRFDKVFTKVENPPAYIGNLSEYLKRTIQYPSEAKEKKVEGRVMIKFIVDEEGNLSHFNAISSVGSGLEEEAIRSIKNSGRWKPAMQNGRKVPFEVIQPIDFNLLQMRTNGFIESLPKSNLLLKRTNEGC